MVGLVGLVGLLAQEPPGPGLGMIIVWNSDQLRGHSVLGKLNRLSTSQVFNDFKIDWWVQLFQHHLKVKRVD